MPRKKKQGLASPSQADLLDITARLRTGPCVPALREAIKAWKAGGCKGVTATTRILLNYWFHTDHRLTTGLPFRYHASQQEAIETLIYVWEYEKVRSRKALLERYAQNLRDLQLPPYDGFARYCIKMATGSGKTKVMSLAIAWHYFNAVNEGRDDFAKTFLILAPNVIVFERLRTDFEGGRIFRTDPIVPPQLEIFARELQCYMRGENERASSLGAIYLSNIQQFYTRDGAASDEPDVMTAVMG